jgi:hypothetical protein
MGGAETKSAAPWHENQVFEAIASKMAVQNIHF